MDYLSCVSECQLHSLIRNRQLIWGDLLHWLIITSVHTFILYMHTHIWMCGWVVLSVELLVLNIKIHRIKIYYWAPSRSHSTLSIPIIIIAYVLQRLEIIFNITYCSRFHTLDSITSQWCHNSFFPVNFSFYLNVFQESIIILKKEEVENFW